MIPAALFFDCGCSIIFDDALTDQSGLRDPALPNLKFLHGVGGLCINSGSPQALSVVVMFFATNSANFLEKGGK